MSPNRNVPQPRLPIRQKLLALVVLACLPALGLALYNGLVAERAALADSEREARRISRDLVLREQHLTAGARQFLATLSRLPAVRNLDAGSCAALFRELLPANPLYSDIVLTATNGDVLASARGAGQAVNLRESAFFGRVLATRAFAVGGYRKSRTTGLDVLVFGHPVFDREGRLVGIVSTGIKLDIFNEVVRDIALPAGSTIFMADRDGLRLFNRHFPDAMPGLYPAGGRISPKVWERLRRGPNDTAFLETGLDGRRRLFVAQESRTAEDDSPYLYAAVSQQESTVRRAALDSLYWGLRPLALAGLLAALAVWLTGRRVFAERIEALAEVAGSFARGDLGARAAVSRPEPPAWPDELDLLGRALDRMGEELSQREAEREATLERLARTQFAVDNAGDEVYWADTRASLVYVNESAARSLGYSREELLGRNVFDIDADIDPERWPELLERLAERGALTFETRHRTRSGTLVPKELTISLVRASGGDLIFGTGHDIRERKRNEAVLRSLLDDTAAVTGEAFFQALTERLVALLDLPAAFAGEYLPGEPVVVRPLAISTGGGGGQSGDFLLDDSPGRDIPRHGHLLVERGAGEAFPNLATLTRLGIEGYLGVPMLDARGEKIGHLSVMSRQPMTADPALISILRLFAQRAAAELVRLRTERDTLASLREKEVLLREIHHRVKNNMQIISSLLSLQARDLADPAMLELVSESRARILSMALVHEDLYQSDSLAEVDFRRYLERLAERVRSGIVGAGRARFALRLGELSLPVDQAVPLGLVCNELLTNALKHALPDDREGTVTVELERLDGQARLMVRDDGPGLPPGFDPLACGTLGMQLVWSLADQLHGEVAARNEGGAVFEVRFPLDGREARPPAN